MKEMDRKKALEIVMDAAEHHAQELHDFALQYHDQKGVDVASFRKIAKDITDAIEALRGY